jgi:hypothetical protein
MTAGLARWRERISLARATEVRLLGLAVLHAALLYGVFQQDHRATTVARYLVVWPIAEAATLIIVPTFMVITAEDRTTPRWLRAIWFPATLLAMGGLGGVLRLLRATWFYFLTCVPVLFVRHTRADAQVGCSRSWVNLFVLVGLLAVFGNRPTVWPIGTLAGRWMSPDLREAANLMACGVAYYALAAVVETLMRRYAAAVNRSS